LDFVVPLDSARRPQVGETPLPVTTAAAADARRPGGLRATDTLVLGCGLLVIAAIGGLYFAIRPNAGRLDQWIGDVVPLSRSGWLTDVTWLRYPLVIIGGSAVCAALCYSRDRWRALACLVGPPLALVLCELVAKPLVGRTLGGSLSYPSGSTVGAAALAIAVVLATSPRWRPVSVVVAAVYVLWMAVAVVSLQWHYPTDAMGGLAFGAGVVLAVDGLFHLAQRCRPRRDGLFGR
jgi:membrane-associated phospholipid phosphatase